ncbi:MAG: hypothetical protein ACI8X3_003039, partial [Saprospiraceae bacterium]
FRKIPIQPNVIKVKNPKGVLIGVFERVNTVECLV